MKAWEKSFAERLGQVRSRWAGQLDEVLDKLAVPVFDELASFLRQHGFSATVPLRDKGRRSFKFEMAEDAFLLMIFEAKAVGETELTREVFVLGREPAIRKTTERLSGLDEDWFRGEFQEALDLFVELLNSEETAPEEEELVVA